MVSEPSTEQLNEALDRIHDIASKAALVEGMPAEVEKALDEIIALSRYKFDVVGPKS
jgi:hypothetical protein